MESQLVIQTPPYHSEHNKITTLTLFHQNFLGYISIDASQIPFFVVSLPNKSPNIACANTRIQKALVETEKRFPRRQLTLSVELQSDNTTSVSRKQLKKQNQLAHIW